MNSEKLQNAIEMINDNLILDAKKAHKKPPFKSPLFISSVAAMLIVTITFGLIVFPKTASKPGVPAEPSGSTENQQTQESYSSDDLAAKEDYAKDSSAKPPADPSDSHISSKSDAGSSNTQDVKLKALSATKAVYPDMPQRPTDFPNTLSLKGWETYRREQVEKYRNQNVQINTFFKKSIPVFLSDSNDKNALYSPVNVYMALSMLAETTGGNSQKQVLDLLGVDSMAKLRADAKTVWESNYCNDGVTTTVFANSLWLNQHVQFKQDTLNTIKDNFFASSFSGDPVSEEYNNMMREWLNEQTGGLLKDYVKDIKMNQNMILTLLSTIYYKAAWSGKFLESNTKSAVFHSNSADITCSLMSRVYAGTYYTGNNFSMVSQDIDGSGKIFYILPDKGVSVDSVVKNSSIIDYLTNPDLYESSSAAHSIKVENKKIRLSVPKLDISTNFSIIDKLKNLGVTDVFDPSKSDFSPLVEYGSGLSVSQADHAIRLKTDENGCTAAAYTQIVISKSAVILDDIVEFTVDRPFMFVITSPAGTILFTGVVNNPS